MGRMGRGITVLLSGLVLGSCASRSERASASPPAPPSAATGARPALSVAKASGPRYTIRLNAEHAEHGTIFRGADGACFVTVPREAAPPGEVRLDHVPGDPKAVDCPERMLADFWLACPGGRLVVTEAHDACACQPTGHPPPPPRPLTCPAELPALLASGAPDVE